MLEDRIPEVIRKLDAGVKAAVKEGAELVEGSAELRVDKDTGKLARAIHIEKDNETDDGWYVIAGNKDVYYGHMVEHGTVQRPPHPFLVPALEEHREHIIESVRAAMRRAT